MVRFSSFILLFLFWSACESSNEPQNELNENTLDDGVLKILFIGNSHTYYNNLSSSVALLIDGKVADEKVKIMTATGGGLALKDHASSESTKTSITLENWDYVVIQENGGYATFPLEDAEVEIYPFARKLKHMIKTNNEDTKILLYMTHAYKNGGYWCDEDPFVCSYELMQNEIRRNYLQLENILSADIAPAGMMWWMILDQIDIPLWADDEYHPSPKGSYISALTIATYFTGQEITKDDLLKGAFHPDEEEKIIQSINNSIYYNNPDWRTY